MRRRRKRKHQEVELNLAAMLDMAFQLLAFFILTFRPSPVEAELAMYLPPSMPITNVQARNLPTSTTGGVGLDPQLEKTVVLQVMADARGNLTGVAEEGQGIIFRGGPSASNLYALEHRLRELFGFPGSPFEQVQLQSSPELRYEEFMRVLDVCLKQKLANGQPLEKIGFVEAPGEASATGGAAPAAGM
jgi:biopolymer transport protein ExbD